MSETDDTGPVGADLQCVEPPPECTTPEEFTRPLTSENTGDVVSQDPTDERPGTSENTGEIMEPEPLPPEPEPEPPYELKAPLIIPAAPQGVDFYYKDGEIDFVELRKGGKSFAIRKATEGLTVQRGLSKDKIEMYEAGLISGFYCFFRPSVDPQAQADAYLQAVGELNQRCIEPVIDLEAGPRNFDGRSPADVIEAAQGMAKALHAALGVWPIVYTSARVVREELDGLNTGLAALGCKLWVVWCKKGQPVCPPEWGPGNWLIQQYALDNRETHGARQVDLNRWNVLKIGDRGPLVKYVQRKLGAPSSAQSGEFDKATDRAVRQFQRDLNLTEDGRVGPVTWAALAWHGNDEETTEE